MPPPTRGRSERNRVEFGEPDTQEARARRLEVIEKALACNHPTGDIEEMLADIERGRNLPRP
ncbi:MAG: hypothetical protein OXM56_09765 [Gammaproteobacteria bacterium]|nr:hypothetical protein [Gammaproteobacteria bacterium]